jgi:hypothetical protein
MSGFESRLIEDFGHELSDLVVAGEELMSSADERPQTPYLYALEFRGLLVTLETGARLLQWEEFGNFLSALGLRIEMSCESQVPSGELRSKFQKSLELLLKIHEEFDGLSFSSEQISIWESWMDKIWLARVESLSEATTPTTRAVPPEIPASAKRIKTVEMSASTDDGFFMPPLEPSAEPSTDGSTDPSTENSIDDEKSAKIAAQSEGLWAESGGIRIFFPLIYLRGTWWKTLDLENSKTIEICGFPYERTLITQHSPAIMHRDGWRFEGRREMVLIRCFAGDFAVEVDRVLGFQTLNGKDLKKQSGPAEDLVAQVVGEEKSWVWDRDGHFST